MLFRYFTTELTQPDPSGQQNLLTTPQHFWYNAHKQYPNRVYQWGASGCFKVLKLHTEVKLLE